MASGMTSIFNWGRSLKRRRTPSNPQARARSIARRSTFEILEGRITPTTFLVVNALDGPGDGPSGSLRSAITQANQSGDASDTIVITPKVKGSIALNAGELTIDTSLTIMNRSGAPIEISQTTSGARVFEVSSNATRVNIGGRSAREMLTIDGGNVSSGNGGGILVDNAANVLTLSHVNLTGNSAGSAASSDASQNGGGIDSLGRVVLVQSHVGGNQTSGNGGGIWAGAGVSMSRSSVDGNQAGTGGGGLYVNSGDVSMTSNSSVSGNSALLGTAGGMTVAAGNTLVSQSRVDDNRAFNAGGINEVKGNVQIVKGSEVNRNSSSASLDISAGNFGGGGIVEGIGDVLVSRSQVSDNHSLGMYSSGIVSGLGSVTVTQHSRINGNTNRGPGGGIAANFGGFVTVSGGSQVNNNTGSGNGGGIVNFAGPMGGVRVLGHSQVSHNTVTNYETLGQAVSVFLELVAGSLGIDFTTATGGLTPDAVTAEISAVESEVVSTNAEGEPGFLVSGGGIGTLLGGSITVSGGSHVDDNLSGLQVPSGNSRSIGIGGGLFSGLGSITLNNSTVNGNTSTGSGGGVWNQGSMTVVSSAISNDTAMQSPGGGLFNSIHATASFLRGTLKGNRASDGGGVYNRGSLNLTKSAVTRNHATIQGGGISNHGQMNLIRTTVVGNTPDNLAPPA